MQGTSKAITLLELIVAVALLSVVILALENINVFSNYHVVSSDHRAKLQNEVSLALERMTKEMGITAGNEMVSGANTVLSVTAPSDIADLNMVSFQVDTGTDSLPDQWYAFRFRDKSAPAAERNGIYFCNSCSGNNAACAGCSGGGGWSDPDRRVASNIVRFLPSKPTDGQGNLNSNSINIDITACWDPTTANTAVSPNGTADNPCVNMISTIKLPLVSAN